MSSLPERSRGVVFALAVLAYGEQARGAEVIAFSGVWCALALYNIDIFRSRRQRAEA